MGAIADAPVEEPNPYGLSQYGPDWYSVNSVEDKDVKHHTVGSSAELEIAVNEANHGDTIVLTA